MIGIKSIIKGINKLFDRVRPPAPQISRLLMVCSMMKRPGLSVITSVSNVANALAGLGIPIGTMPDGSTNLTLGFLNEYTSEIFRALKFDASVQVGIQPGTMSSVGVGSNAGGPMTVISNIINAGQGYGQIQ